MKHEAPERHVTTTIQVIVTAMQAMGVDDSKILEIAPAFRSDARRHRGEGNFDSANWAENAAHAIEERVVSS